MIDFIQAVKGAGFAYLDDIIHLFVGGSALHGAKIEGTDDLDIYGLYIEPPERIVGLDLNEHFVWSTADQYARNTAQDIDVTLYSLRKFAGLACKGNPTALHFLFAPNGAPYARFWTEIAPEIKKCVLSKAAAKQFIGFVDAQMGRLLGTRGRGKKGQRPELEETYGYDVKAGMHAIRLLHECIEMLSTGEITLPRPERDLLIKIRTGAWSLDRLSASVNALVELVHKAEAASPLPDKPDRAKLSKIVADAYLRYWREEKADRSLRRQSRELHRRIDEETKLRQDQCNHLAGGLGPEPYGNSPTCIVWHIFEDDTEHAVGICMHCGKQWRYTDPDYATWRAKRSINTLSTGGIPVKSSAYPYSPGRTVSTVAIEGLSASEPVDEPPLDLTLKEFVVAELVKRFPEKAAQILCKDPDVYQALRKELWT